MTLVLLGLTSAFGSTTSKSAAPFPFSKRLLKLRGGAVEACLFDFDGTLVQSEDVHRRSFGTVLGVELTEKYWNERCVGRSPRMIMEQNLPPDRLRPGETIDDLLTKRSALFEQHIEQGLLEATSGAEAFVKQARQRGVRCVVVSSGSRAYIVKALEALGLTSDIEFVLAGDDEVVVACGKHKPDPFPYLHAAEMLGVAPAACLAFEDSLSGIRSAQAAAMPVVVIRNILNEHLEVSKEAPGVVPPPVLSPEAPLLPVVALVAGFNELPQTIFD